MTEPEPREELFSALGVTISPDLLIQALTHRSFSHEHPGTSTVSYTHLTLPTILLV